jgi:hypothetical protein
MKQSDWMVLFGALVVCVTYQIVGGREMRGRPLLRASNAVAFEAIEIIVLCILVWYAARCSEYGFAVVFALALLEHFLQVFYCYRQSSYGPRNTITLVWFFILLSFAMFRGVWWAAAAFGVGVLIHTYMMILKRPFIDLVCVKQPVTTRV